MITFYVITVKQCVRDYVYILPKQSNCRKRSFCTLHIPIAVIIWCHSQFFSSQLTIGGRDLFWSVITNWCTLTFVHFQWMMKAMQGSRDQDPPTNWFCLFIWSPASHTTWKFYTRSTLLQKRGYFTTKVNIATHHRTNNMSFSTLLQTHSSCCMDVTFNLLSISLCVCVSLKTVLEKGLLMTQWFTVKASFSFYKLKHSKSTPITILRTCSRFNSLLILYTCRQTWPFLNRGCWIITMKWFTGVSNIILLNDKAKQ